MAANRLLPPEVEDILQEQVRNVQYATQRQQFPEVIARQQARELRPIAPNIARRIGPHPSKGGSQGYNIHQRIDAIRYRIMEYPTVPSRMSVIRWTKNGVALKLKKGGPKKKFSGRHLMMITLFLMAYPDATLEEMRSFLHNNTTSHLLMSTSRISEVLHANGYTRKKISHVSTRAFSPENIQRRETFWHTGFPTGIQGIS